jgi:hypothetical protein
MILVAMGILAYDLYRELIYRRALSAAPTGTLPPLPELRWRASLALALLAWGPLLLALSIVVGPSGTAGVRVSQTSGTLLGTLNPGVHFGMPPVEKAALFDTRDQIFTTGTGKDGKAVAANVTTYSQLLRRASERRSDAGVGHNGALPARPRAAGLHPRQSGTAGRERDCSSNSGQRRARVGSALHGAGCVFRPARRAAAAGGGADCSEADGGRDCGEGSDATRHPLAPECAQGLETLLLKERRIRIIRQVAVSKVVQRPGVSNANCGL